MSSLSSIPEIMTSWVEQRRFEGIPNVGYLYTLQEMVLVETTKKFVTTPEYIAHIQHMTDAERLFRLYFASFDAKSWDELLAAV